MSKPKPPAKPARSDLGILINALHRLRGIAAGVALARIGTASRAVEILRCQDRPPTPLTIEHVRDIEAFGKVQLFCDLQNAAAVNPPGPHSQQVVRLAQWCLAAAAAFRRRSDEDLLETTWDRWAEKLQEDDRSISVRRPQLEDLLRDEYSRIGQPAEWKPSPLQERILAALRQHGPMGMADLFARMRNPACGRDAFRKHVPELVKRGFVVPHGKGKAKVYSAR